MKSFAAVLLIAVLLCACSKEEPQAPVRPGVENPAPSTPDGYPEVDFAAGNATEHRTDGADGEIHIILYRKASNRSLPYACALSLTEGSDFASIDRQADFARGSSTAEAVLRFSPSKMGAQRRAATVKLTEEGKSLSIVFIKTDTQWSQAEVMLMFDGREFKRVEARYRKEGDKTDWLISREGVERRFTVDKGIPSVSATGSVAEASVYGKAELWPAVGVPCYYSDEFIALNVCAIAEGKAEFPHTEYFFRQAGQYATAKICDGWLLPVLAIDAKLLDPASNMWSAPARIEPDGSLTVFSPYHHLSPVHIVNGAPLSATWHISLNGAEASLKPQFSGFSNKDVFDFDFTIAAEGRCEGDMSKIVFDRPMHNCNADGLKNGIIECTWANLQPTIIEIVLRIEHQSHIGAAGR